MPSHEVTFSFLSDEALLCLQRLGITYARDVLSVRYFQNRNYLMHTVAPKHRAFLDEWTANEAFFVSYLKSENEYEFGKGPFKAFFLLILKRELYREIGSVIRARSLMPTVSFESDVCEGGHLADIMPDASSSNDPRAFVNYAETLEKLGKLPAVIPPIAVKMAHLILYGYTIKTASKELGLSFSYGKQIMKKFREWAKKVVHRPSVDGDSDEDEEEDMFNVPGLDDELDS